MSYFNNKKVEILECPFTPIENALETLKNRGFCFIENAVSIPFEYSHEIQQDESFKKIVEYNVGAEEYNIIMFHFFNSKLSNEFLKNNRRYFVSNIDLRILKNSKGTFLHKDSDVFYDEVFDLDIFTCWTPLVNTNFTTGTIAIVDSFKNQEHRNTLLVKKSILTKKYKNIDNLDFNSVAISRGFYPTDKVYNKEHNEWENHGNKFYAKHLKVGDVALFTKETLHASLDTIDGVRVSLDFRIALLDTNKQKILKGVLNDKLS